MKQTREPKIKAETSQRRGMGITVKLVAAIVVSVIAAGSSLLAGVYKQMSQVLLEKSEEMLRITTDRRFRKRGRG